MKYKEISKRGAVFVRYGRKHDIYKNPKTGTIEQISRHSDIEESLARNIIKHFSL